MAYGHPTLAGTLAGSSFHSSGRGRGRRKGISVERIYFSDLIFFVFSFVYLIFSFYFLHLSNFSSSSSLTNLIFPHSLNFLLFFFPSYFPTIIKIFSFSPFIPSFFFPFFPQSSKFSSLSPFIPSFFLFLPPSLPSIINFPSFPYHLSLPFKFPVFFLFISPQSLNSFLSPHNHQNSSLFPPTIINFPLSLSPFLPSLKMHLASSSSVQP